MSTIYQVILYSHITVGFISLVTFWIPVLTKKGSQLHARTGHWYAKAMYGVGLTALILAVMAFTDPLAAKFPNHTMSDEQLANTIREVKDIGVFLFAIAILTITNVRTGLLTLQAKRDHSKLRAPAYLLLNAILLTAGVYLIFRASGGAPLSVLFYVFAGLCSFNAITNFRYIYKDSVTRADRITAHITNMIGAGIGAHTAFLLFGASRLISHLLTGYWGLVPWFLPAVFGSIIIVVQTRKYRRKAKPKLALASV